MTNVKNDFNLNHPELRADEVFVGNNDCRAFRRWKRALPSLRRGTTAYTKSGKTCVPDENGEAVWFPYFAPAKEIDAIGGLPMLEVAAEDARTQSTIVIVDGSKYLVVYREELNQNPNTPCADCCINEHQDHHAHEWAIHRTLGSMQAALATQFPKNPIDLDTELGHKIIAAMHAQLRVGEVVCIECSIQNLFDSMEKS